MTLQLHLPLEDRNPEVTSPSVLHKLSILITDIAAFEADIINALAYANGTHTFDDIVAGIMQGRYIFWPLENSFVIWELVEYPRKKYLHVFLAGGDLAELDSVVPRLKHAATLAGCSAVTLNGRRGWLRALTDEGWRETSYSLICEVNNNG